MDLSLWFALVAKSHLNKPHWPKETQGRNSVMSAWEGFGHRLSHSERKAQNEAKKTRQGIFPEVFFNSGVSLNVFLGGATNMCMLARKNRKALIKHFAFMLPVVTSMSYVCDVCISQQMTI